MRSILVHADRRPGLEARIETALSLVRAHDGHMTVLIDTPVTRYMSMEPMGGSYIASDALTRAMEDDDANAARIEERLRGENVSFSFLRSEAEPVAALSEAGRVADLLVLSRSSGLVGDVALQCRTPVLALPDERALHLPVNKACVAWDGGDEAAHALRGSVGLLAGCAEVAILTVLEKPGGLPIRQAVEYLSRHGISGSVEELQRKGSTEETLARGVAQSRAELLIMGAYGHSRVREYLFGGVTRHFLEADETPALFLTH